MRLPIGYRQKYGNVYRVKVGERKRAGVTEEVYGRVLTAKERAEWADQFDKIMERQPYGRKLTLEDV